MKQKKSDEILTDERYNLNKILFSNTKRQTAYVF